jgi:hypothetical protein
VPNYRRLKRWLPVFSFLGKLLKAVAADARARMGTTWLAVGVGAAPWIASRLRELFTGAVVHWGDWTLLWTVAVWLILFVLSLSRHYRPLLREHRRVFRVPAFNQDQVSDADRISIWCLLEFCKDFGPGDLTVRVTTLLPGGATLATRVTHTETLRVSKDERKRLTLGSLRILRAGRPAYHSVWGSEPGTEDLRAGQVTILTDARHLIDISLGPQTYRCYIEFVTAPPEARSAAMYMTDEDRSPWVLSL